MKSKISPALVGFFVLGFVVLGILALLSFGGVNFFSKPQRFVVYFDESVHGLDLGSPVKLRGVRVGRVVDLALNYDDTHNEAVVAVTCELSRNMMRDKTGAMIDVSSRQQLDKMIDHGLRAQLGVLGLATGLLFVELDFVEEAELPVGEVVKGGAVAVIPAMPSAISEFQASLTEILSGLKRVDFPGLSKELHGLLADTRKQVNGLNLAELNASWSRGGQVGGRPGGGAGDTADADAIAGIDRPVDTHAGDDRRASGAGGRQAQCDVGRGAFGDRSLWRGRWSGAGVHLGAKRVERRGDARVDADERGGGGGAAPRRVY